MPSLDPQNPPALNLFPFPTPHPHHFIISLHSTCPNHQKMAFWRNDYPRDLLEAVNTLRESPPRLTTPHVYVVMFKDLRSRSPQNIGVLKSLFDPDAANELAMNHFKDRFTLWFIETCAFENWVRGGVDPGGFCFVVNWDLVGGQAVSLHASIRSPKEPRNLQLLGSVWVEYHPIH